MSRDVSDSLSGVGPPETTTQFGSTSTGETYTSDVFITHCEADADFAFQLYHGLEERGLKCSLAKKDFRPGLLIYDQIITAITESKKILAILSGESLKSYWCTLELSLTLERTKEDDKVPIVPVVRRGLQKSDLPDVLMQLEYVFESQENFWEAISKVIHGPDTSVRNLLPVGNVGHGLTWSYFYSFLNIIMPEMDRKIEELPYWSWSQERCIPRKIYLFLPESCKCPRRLTEADETIQFDRLLWGDEFYTISRGGKERKYNCSVYKIESENKTYYFLGEFCSVIGSLKLIEDGEMAGLSSGEKSRQVVRFKYTLKDVLCHAFPDKAEVILYDDTDPDVKLSSLILRKIKKDIENDIERDRLAELHQVEEACRLQNNHRVDVDTGPVGLDETDCAPVTPPCAQLASLNLFPHKSKKAGEYPEYPSNLTSAHRPFENNSEPQEAMLLQDPDDKKGLVENECGAHISTMSPNQNARAPPGDHWKYYAFIMYGNGEQDLKLACRMLHLLEWQHGLKCAIKDRDLIPGECMVNGMGDLTTRSRRIILILSDETTENILSIFHMLRIPDRDQLHESIQPIPVLRDPIRMRREITDFCSSLAYLEVKEETFDERLFSAVMADVRVPRLPAGDVAEGFVWSYFYSYLKLMLPSLKERIRKMENSAEIKDRISHKMFLFLPSSGLVLGTLAEMLNVHHFDTVSLVLDTAGNIKRRFDSSVYRIFDPGDNQAYYFVGEYITPLVVLKDMATGQIAGLSSDSRQHQVDRLYRRLEEILNHDQARDLQATWRFFPYEDGPGYNSRMAEEILRVIREEIAEQGAL